MTHHGVFVRVGFEGASSNSTISRTGRRQELALLIPEDQTTILTSCHYQVHLIFIVTQDTDTVNRRSVPLQLIYRICMLDPSYSVKLYNTYNVEIRTLYLIFKTV